MCTKSGIVVKLTGAHVVVFPRRCKSWGCPDCSKIRRRALIREGMAGKPNRFITLTVNPHNFGSPEERAARLAKAWRLAIASYRHKYPAREAEYLCVFEATKNGEPHLHILWRGGWVDQKWLSSEMDKRMGAPIVDVRWAKGGQQVAEYVAKYISKRNIRFGTCKRYWSSGGYLQKSPAQERRERNEGSLFFVASRHIITYLCDVIGCKITVAMQGPRHFEFELPEGRSSPPRFWPEDAMNWAPS